MFHLRHIGPSSQSDSLICLKKTVTIIGRKRDEVDHVICSRNYKMNAIVSRRHCRLKAADGIVEIIDDSRNGVFVNDVKIDGRVVITEGDVVTMGHPSGEKLRSGTRVRQPNSEYQYILERCFCEETNHETRQATNTEPVISVTANKPLKTDEQQITELPAVKIAPQTVSDRVMSSLRVLKESNIKGCLATPQQQFSAGSLKSSVEHNKGMHNIPACQENTKSVQTAFDLSEEHNGVPQLQLHTASASLKTTLPSECCNKPTAAESISVQETVFCKPATGETCSSAHKAPPHSTAAVGSDVNVLSELSSGHVPETSSGESAGKNTVLLAQSDNVEYNHSMLPWSEGMVEIVADLSSAARVSTDKVHYQESSVQGRKLNLSELKALHSEPDRAPACMEKDLVNIESEHAPNNSEDLRVSSLPSESEAMVETISVSKLNENRNGKISARQECVTDTSLQPGKNNLITESKLEDGVVTSLEVHQIQLSEPENNIFKCGRVTSAESENSTVRCPSVRSVIPTEHESVVMTEAIQELESLITKDDAALFQQEHSMERNHILQTDSEKLVKQGCPPGHVSKASVELVSNESEMLITKCGASTFQQETSVEKEQVSIIKPGDFMGKNQGSENDSKKDLSSLPQISRQENHNWTTNSVPLTEKEPFSGPEAMISCSDIRTKSALLITRDDILSVQSVTSTEKISVSTSKPEHCGDEDRAPKSDLKDPVEDYPTESEILTKENALSSKSENFMEANHILETTLEDKVSVEDNPTESEAFITKDVPLSSQSDASREKSNTVTVKFNDFVKEDKVSKKIIQNELDGLVIEDGASEMFVEKNYVSTTTSENLGHDFKEAVPFESKTLSSESHITEEDHPLTSESENVEEEYRTSEHKSKEITDKDLEDMKRKHTTEAKLDERIEKDAFSLSQGEVGVNDSETVIDNLDFQSHTKVLVEKSKGDFLDLTTDLSFSQCESVKQSCTESSLEKSSVSPAESGNLKKQDISAPDQHASTAVSLVQCKTETCTNCYSGSKHETSKMSNDDNVDYDSDAVTGRECMQNAGTTTLADLNDPGGGMELDSTLGLQNDARRSCSGVSATGRCVDRGHTSVSGDLVSVNEPELSIAVGEVGISSPLCANVHIGNSGRLPQRDTVSSTFERRLAAPLLVNQHTPKQHVRSMKHPHSCEPPNKRLRRELTANLAPLCLSPGLASQFLKTPGLPQFSYVESVLTGMLNHSEPAETEEHQFSDAEIDAESSSSPDSREDQVPSSQDNVTDQLGSAVDKETAPNIWKSVKNERVRDSNGKSNLPVTALDDSETEDSLNLYLDLSQTCSTSMCGSQADDLNKQETSHFCPKAGDVCVKEDHGQVAEQPRGSESTKHMPGVLTEKYLCTQCGLVMAMDDKENHCHPDASGSQNSDDSDADYFLVEEDDEDYRVEQQGDKSEAPFLPCSKRRRITFEEDEEADSTHLDASHSGSGQRSKANPGKSSQAETLVQKMSDAVPEVLDVKFVGIPSYRKQRSVALSVDNDDARDISGVDSCLRRAGVEHRAVEEEISGIHHLMTADPMVKEGERCSSVPCVLTVSSVGLSDSQAVRMQNEWDDAERATMNDIAGGSDSSHSAADVADRHIIHQGLDTSAVNQKGQQQTEMVTFDSGQLLMESCTSGNQMYGLQKTVLTKSQMNQLVTKACTSGDQMNELHKCQKGEAAKEICAGVDHKDQMFTDVCANDSHVSQSNTQASAVDSQLSQSRSDSKVTSLSTQAQVTEKSTPNTEACIVQMYGLDMETSAVGHLDTQTSGHSQPDTPSSAADDRQDQCDSLVSAVDTQHDTQTSAVDTPQDTQTSAVDSQHDTQTSAVDTQHDTQTSAVDTPRDTRTSAVDSQHDTQTSAVDTPQDTQTSAFDTPQDTQTSAVDSQHDTQTSAVDSQHDTETSAVERQHDTQTSAVDTPQDTQTSAVDSQHDTQTSAVDTQHDTQTSAVDTPRDTRTSAVDSQHDTQTSAVDTPQDTQTSAFDTPQDTQTSAVDSQHDTQTSAVDSQHDTETSAVERQHDTQTSTVDSQHDTQTSAFDSQHDTQTSVVDTPQDTQTSAVDTRCETTCAGLGSVVTYQSLKQTTVNEPRNGAEDTTQTDTKVMEFDGVDLPMDLMSTQTLDDKAEISAVACLANHSDCDCMDFAATQTLNDEVDEIRSIASTVDSTSLYLESTQHSSGLSANLQDCQGTQNSAMRVDDAVSEGASEESFSLYVEPTQGGGSTCAASDHCDVVFSQMSDDSDVLQPRIQDIIHSLEDGSCTDGHEDQARNGDGELSTILEEDENATQPSDNASAASHVSATGSCVVLAELQGSECPSNEQSCSDADSDADSEVFSPLPCHRSAKLSECSP